MKPELDADNVDMPFDPEEAEKLADEIAAAETLPGVDAEGADVFDKAA